ncbi:MAG: mechanosensitive ion channel family protein, partial [Candidatus Aenigmatarchaeota archaeon]
MIPLPDFLAPYLDIILAVCFFIGALILAKVVNVVLRRYLAALTVKTDSILDDIMLRNLSRPIFLAIVLGGVYFAARTLNVLAPYALWLETGFTVVFTLFIAFIVVRIFNGFLEWYAKEVAMKKKAKVDENFLAIIRKVLYLVVFAVALLWMLGQLGIEITTLIATLGIGGLAVALALQPTLSNFFSGTYVIMDRPVKIGDYIELESGERGYIESISWRSTRIRMLGDNLLIIPNSKLAESKIINYYSPRKELSVIVKCGVAYGSDLEKVEK